ncbi:3'-tRNA processing endoribonuclease [Aureococcus anophagefferens]|nr:3'-tRNA processing endoribonuclease [Aureococcus anophagefferens]
MATQPKRARVAAYVELVGGADHCETCLLVVVARLSSDVERTREACYAFRCGEERPPAGRLRRVDRGPARGLLPRRRRVGRSELALNHRSAGGAALAVVCGCDDARRVAAAAVAATSPGCGAEVTTAACGRPRGDRRSPAARARFRVVVRGGGGDGDAVVLVCPGAYDGAAARVALHRGGAAVAPGAARPAAARRVGAALGGLDAIWISHAHLDHCGGLPAVVAAALEARRRRSDAANAAAAAAQRGGGGGAPAFPAAKLLVAAPPRALDALRACGGYEGDCALRELAGPAASLSWGPADFGRRVNHCRDAYAVVLTVGGARVAYSGDCRPSDAFAAAAARGFPASACEVLIHEATFGGDLAPRSRSATRR